MNKLYVYTLIYTLCWFIWSSFVSYCLVKTSSIFIIKNKLFNTVLFIVSSPSQTFGFDSRIYSWGGKKRGCCEATARWVFLNWRIWDTLAALTFGPRRRSDGAVTQANKVSWSWHKCGRPTATSVAPYATRRRSCQWRASLSQRK